MNTRIKKIRNHNRMSQEEFGNRLGITKASISRIESGINNPSEQTLMLICKEFGVNEVWLRTGEGGDDNMFAKISEDDRFSLNLGRLSVTQNQTLINMINAIAEASPEKLKNIEDFMKACLGIDK